MVFLQSLKKENNLSEKERSNVICGLQHRKWKEKKADKLLGKQAAVTMEWFLQFLSLSIYLSTLTATRERERERVSIYYWHRQSDFSDNSKFATCKLVFLLQ